MNNKLQVLETAIIQKERANGDKFYCMSDDIASEYKSQLTDIVFKIDENCHDLDLTYEIMSDACDYVAELTPEQLEDDEETTAEDTFSSVYTQTRLEYLNIWNQDEISDKVKEFASDIQEACAYWYDEQVQNAIYQLVEWVKEK